MSLLLANFIVKEHNLLVEMASDQGHVAVLPAALLVLIDSRVPLNAKIRVFAAVPRPFVDFVLGKAELLLQFLSLVLLEDPVPAVSALQDPVLLHC